MKQNNNKILYAVIIVLLIIVVVLGWYVVSNELSKKGDSKTNEIPNKDTFNDQSTKPETDNKNDSSNVVELFDKEKVDDWLKENSAFFSATFSSHLSAACLYGTDLNIIYDNAKDKLSVLSKYLQTHGFEDEDTLVVDDFVRKVKKDGLLTLSKEIFEDGINLEELKDITDGDYITIDLLTGFGISLPSFWKFEKEEDNIYTMYIADFACAMEKDENIRFVYSPGTALNEDDLKKYNPGIIKIKFKHTKERNYLISSSYIGNYEFK